LLWQQLERVNVMWPDDLEMAAVKCGDPDRAMPFGQGDQHLIAPESLGQHLVGLGRAAAGS
jgi:hypothetical protein